MVRKVVLKIGATVPERDILYKSVVQLMLLYRIDSWVVTGEILKVLEYFCHRLERSIMGITAQCMTGGEWEGPPVAEALKTSGLCSIKEYIQQRKENIVSQVAFRPIYELCMGAEQIPVKRKFIW